MIKVLILVAIASYLVKRFTGSWPWQFISGTSPSRSRLYEAQRLLRLTDSASEEDIRAAYRRLVADAHPDRGGSAARVTALTEARDLLLAKAQEPRG